MWKISCRMFRSAKSRWIKDVYPKSNSNNLRRWRLRSQAGWWWWWWRWLEVGNWATVESKVEKKTKSDYCVPRNIRSWSRRKEKKRSAANVQCWRVSWSSPSAAYSLDLELASTTSLLDLVCLLFKYLLLNQSSTERVKQTGDEGYKARKGSTGDCRLLCCRWRRWIGCTCLAEVELESWPDSWRRKRESSKCWEVYQSLWWWCAFVLVVVRMTSKYIWLILWFGWVSEAQRYYLFWSTFKVASVFVMIESCRRWRVHWKCLHWKQSNRDRQR